MLNHWKTWLWLAAIGIPAFPAAAGMPYPETVECPIGGERFEHVTTASYTTFGQRLDGKPYGSWHFPLDLPRCPGNGLVIFEKFGPDDLERLKPLVASDEYRAMLPVETDYYLAGWLMEKLGREPLDVAWMVVQASWQADGKPALKARYQADYVRRIRAVERGEDEFLWLVLQGRAVNGLRELGRFDEARTTLSALPVKSLDVPVPKESKTAASNEGEIEAARNKRAFLQYFGDLERLIGDRDPASEPVRMIPQVYAAQRCRDEKRLSAPDRQFCESGPMKKAVSKLRD